jgi:archaellum component FlaC
MKFQQLGVSVAIAVLLAAVFFIDVRTGLGFTPWLLYVIPLGLTYWIASVYSPLMVAAVCIALMFVGYALSPPLVPPPIALTNRLFGTVTFLAIAVLIVAYKLLARRLSLLTDQLRQELFERTQDLGRAVRVLKAEMAIKSRDVLPLTDQELGRHLTNVLVVESRRLQEQFGQFEEGKVLSAEHRLEETRNELDRLTKQLEDFQRELLSRERQ